MAAKKVGLALLSRVLNRGVRGSSSSPFPLAGIGRRAYGAEATAMELETPLDPPFPVEYTKLLIDGEFVDSASGKKFPTIDPRSGKLGKSCAPTSGAGTGSCCKVDSRKRESMRILIRPHPAFWRVVHGIAVVYLIFLCFLLFQTRHDTQQFMKYLHPDLGIELEERAYGADCRIYTPKNPDSKFANVKIFIGNQLSEPDFLYF